MRAGIMLFVLAAVTAGCTSTYVTGGSRSVEASYELGTLKAVLAKDVETTVAAAERALEKLNMRVAGTSSDRLVGRIQAYTITGSTVTMTMTALADRVTRLTIRVGAMGEESTSRVILQKVLEEMR
jgi:hypothetical protein